MIVLSASIMDCLHQGHKNLLVKMRAKGEKVVMVLHDDKSCYQIKGKIPIQTVLHRMNNLYITELVDEVLITRSVDPADQFQVAIDKYGAENILFMRADDNLDFPGKWLIDKYNIPIEFVPYTDGISSSLLREELLK